MGDIAEPCGLFSTEVVVVPELRPSPAPVVSTAASVAPTARMPSARGPVDPTTGAPVQPFHHVRGLQSAEPALRGAAMDNLLDRCYRLEALADGDAAASATLMTYLPVIFRLAYDWCGHRATGWLRASSCRSRLHRSVPPVRGMQPIPLDPRGCSSFPLLPLLVCLCSPFEDVRSALQEYLLSLRDRRGIVMPPPPRSSAFIDQHQVCCCVVTCGW